MKEVIQNLFNEIKNYVKNGKLKKEDLDEIAETVEVLKNDAEKTRQQSLLDNLKAQKYFNDKLLSIVESGLTTYVVKSDIEKILNSKDANELKPLLMKPISEFPRPIPKENSDIIVNNQELFDDIYILFTDYTGKEREKYEVEKDPIAFGVLHCDIENANGRKVRYYSEKLIFITDWIDEYCDLTLEKLIEEYGVKKYEVEENDEISTKGF